MTLLLVVIGMGIITFALRLVLILSANRFQLPPALEQALRYAPIAVLSAIVFSEVLVAGGSIHLSLENSRLIAAVAAGLVAWRTQNVLLTIGAGMALYWIL